jgi:hypothetical protein
MRIELMGNCLPVIRASRSKKYPPASLVQYGVHSILPKTVYPVKPFFYV